MKNMKVLLAISLLCSAIRLTEETTYSCNITSSCGCSSSTVTVARIVGGENADISAWKWTVSLNVDGSELCGGSIISPDWILTAAHCLPRLSASIVNIHAGSNVRWSGVQRRTALRVIPHPSYDAATFINDIALLQLNESLLLNESNVGTICLPSVPSSILEAEEWPLSNTTVVAVGWGRLNQHGRLPDQLQQVTLYTIASTMPMCDTLLKSRADQFCAGRFGGGKDTCQGDSGGPLMMFTQNKQWILVGITSHGIGCALPEYAGVYTRVAAYESWIKSYVSDAHWISFSSHARILSPSIDPMFVFMIVTCFMQFFQSTTT